MTKGVPLLYALAELMKMPSKSYVRGEFISTGKAENACTKEVRRRMLASVWK